MQEISTSLPISRVRDSPEDVVEDVVDAFCVGVVGVAVDYHEERDGSFVLVVCFGVPGPGCELRVSLECYGALAYCKAGGNEPIGP